MDYFTRHADLAETWIREANRSDASEHECYAAGRSHSAALQALARRPAPDIAACREKARALETCIERRSGEPETFEGDCGLAASTLRDLMRLAA